MTDRPRFFDDLAGVAGGAVSALAGLREEAETMIRTRLDEAIRRLQLVRREELEAVQEMAANARAGQEAATKELAELRQRLDELEAKVADFRQSSPPPSVPPGPLDDE
jgi:BMFP domain-containing protein YqiC